MADIPGMVESIAKGLAENAEAVKVTAYDRGRQKVVRLEVAQEDMGRVIGRDGRVANAIRSLLKAAPQGEQWWLEIVD